MYWKLYKPSARMVGIIQSVQPNTVCILTNHLWGSVAQLKPNYCKNILTEGVKWHFEYGEHKYIRTNPLLTSDIVAFLFVFYISV